MAKKFCQQCSMSLMPSLMMCPTCGGRSFGPNPPTNTSPSASNSNTTSSNLTNLNSTRSSVQFVPGSIGKRAVAYVIDIVIVAFIGIIPVMFSHLVTSTVGNGVGGFVSAVSLLAAVICPYLYFVILNSSSLQATYGKKWLGLKLIQTSGETVTKLQAFLRLLYSSIVPFALIGLFTLSIGGMAINYKDEMGSAIGIAFVIGMLLIIIGPYLLALFNPLKQTLYDFMVKTIVVES